MTEARKRKRKRKYVYKPKNIRRKRLEKANSILLQVARKYMLSVKTMRGPDRHAHIVAARREFCLTAHAEGIGCILLGKALWRHHDTVQYYLNPAKQGERQRRYQARRDEIRQAA